VAPADRVLIVTTPEVSAVRDADRIIGLIEAEEKGPPELILNRIRMDMVKRGDMLHTDDVIDVLAVKLIGVVPDDEKIIISTNQGRPASMENGSMAGQAFRNIAARLEGQDVPFVNFEENGSIIKRISNFFKMAA
jgi:septum site-determining protein MinD